MIMEKIIILGVISGALFMKRVNEVGVVRLEHNLLHIASDGYVSYILIYVRNSQSVSCLRAPKPHNN